MATNFQASYISKSKNLATYLQGAKNCHTLTPLVSVVVSGHGGTQPLRSLRVGLPRHVLGAFFSTNKGEEGFRGISLPKTNMAMENHHVQIGNASSNGGFSIAILVFEGYILPETDSKTHLKIGLF